jgi:hypothetical protein
VQPITGTAECVKDEIQVCRHPKLDGSCWIHASSVARCDVTTAEPSTGCSNFHVDYPQNMATEKLAAALVTEQQ